MSVEKRLNKTTPFIAIIAIALFLRALPTQAQGDANATMNSTAATNPASIAFPLDIAPVWAGHPVSFCLLTAGEHQFVAFYDAERHMTVAQRRLDSKEWRFKRLPSDLVWDSHNSVTMAMDDAGCLHLSGNMHVVPLVYFRTAAPYDIDTFERVPAMVGQNEERCTYPRFMRGPDGRLIFAYRDGQSGDGVDIYNVYDAAAKTWSRLLDAPLLSGEGKMNAYSTGPKLGPDDYYHLVWIWRDTPDCATNHDVSYARSKDLVHWEKSGGDALTLPITIANGEVVDPVPAGGGAINMNVHLGFDSQARPVVSYHKFDAGGNTQAYSARREADGWHVYQTSDWDYRWEFSGGGCIPAEIIVGSVTVEHDGGLGQSYSHIKYGGGTWRLDETTLKPVGTIERKSSYPAGFGRPESTFKGMEVRCCADSGKSGEPNVEYVLRWETLPPNRDRPRDPPLPEPTMLRLYRFPKPTS